METHKDETILVFVRQRCEVKGDQRIKPKFRS